MLRAGKTLAVTVEIQSFNWSGVKLIQNPAASQRQPAGEEATRQYLAQHAQASAQELIEGLAKLGDDWGGARPQDDDVTFVVLKLS